MLPVLEPTKHTRSARFTTRLAALREYLPTAPTASGWVPGMVSFPLSEVTTGMERRSARATRWSEAREIRTPPPATITGRSALSRRSSAEATSLGSGRGRTGGTEANPSSTHGSRSPSSTSIWPSLPANWT